MFVLDLPINTPSFLMQWPKYTRRMDGATEYYKEFLKTWESLLIKMLSSAECKNVYNIKVCFTSVDNEEKSVGFTIFYNIKTKAGRMPAKLCNFKFKSGSLRILFPFCITGESFNTITIFSMALEETLRKLYGYIT